MTSENLERRCIELFRQNGKRLYKAMMQIARKDFCVATSWEPNQVSIAKGCYNAGTVFELTPDYQAIILPGEEGMPVRIKDLSYRDIAKYLPRSKGRPGQDHCALDNQPIRKS